MKLVYIAGPFSAPTRAGVDANIQRAVHLGLGVAALGAFPVIPHANTAHPDFERVQLYPFWIEGTAELMRRCDAVMMHENWMASSGARGEHAEAIRIGLPVFYRNQFIRLSQWLKTGIVEHATPDP